MLNYHLLTISNYVVHTAFDRINRTIISFYYRTIFLISTEEKEKEKVVPDL